jgi:hypothetical protein
LSSGVKSLGISYKSAAAIPASILQRGKRAQIELRGEFEFHLSILPEAAQTHSRAGLERHAFEILSTVCTFQEN